jgi:hypothetical protein
MTQVPLSVMISTRDSLEGRDVQHQYIVRTRHPRWELLRILVRALFEIRFR